LDQKLYDLSNVCLYKINKKLHIKNRLFNQLLAETLVDPENGEILAAEGTILERRTLDRILPYLEKNIGLKTAKPMGGVG
ncbi:hypothetical protein JDS99_31515, partial [Bacillus cereus group sp. N6]|uniref:hypothetical protein n=1 Tax=Bacillus cereus group sp. N6 TaxID=2794583 RepID=UPI0018F73C95